MVPKKTNKGYGNLYWGRICNGVFFMWENHSKDDYRRGETCGFEWRRRGMNVWLNPCTSVAIIGSCESSTQFMAGDESPMGVIRVGRRRCDFLGDWDAEVVVWIYNRGRPYWVCVGNVVPPGNSCEYKYFLPNVMSEWRKSSQISRSLASVCGSFSGILSRTDTPSGKKLRKIPSQVTIDALVYNTLQISMRSSSHCE